MNFQNSRRLGGWQMVNIYSIKPAHRIRDWNASHSTGDVSPGSLEQRLFCGSRAPE
jgi:hypothetical protein